MPSALTVTAPAPAGTVTVSPLPAATSTVLTWLSYFTVKVSSYLPLFDRLIASVPSQDGTAVLAGVTQDLSPPLYQASGPFDRLPGAPFEPSFLSPYRGPLSVMVGMMSSSVPKNVSTCV